MVEHIFTLLMLILLQAVLGFDNLLYISLESKNAPKEKQAYVRKMGILLAIVLRIALLFILVKLIDYFQESIFSLPFVGIIEGEFNIHSLIELGGGIFIIYTAMKEIWHMIGFKEETTHVRSTKKRFGCQSYYNDSYYECCVFFCIPY